MLPQQASPTSSEFGTGPGRLLRETLKIKLAGLVPLGVYRESRDSPDLAGFHSLISNLQCYRRETAETYMSKQNKPNKDMQSFHFEQ